MSAIQQLLTEHIDIWTAAETEKKSGRGRTPNSATSVYGITKLRELILELAVHGKLVPQNASDEPASELLKRIQVEKAKLVADGKIKKDKLQAAIVDDERSSQLPKGWILARLSDAFDVRDGTHDSPKFQESGYPFVTSKNLSSGKLDLNDVKFISEEDHKKFSIRSNVELGDILFAMIGSIGNPAIVDIEIKFSIKNVALIKFYSNDSFNRKYLLLDLKHSSRKMKNEAGGGVQSFISLGNFRKHLIPIPPLLEQHRIVAKVDELMTLCDQLEDQHVGTADVHEQLVSHLLGTLTQSQGAADFDANWQRIAAHFDTLFTTEASIDALKQTLLQLAVMGKLVAQDANDEPGSEFLKRIQAEKGKLIAEGKIKKDKPSEAIQKKEIRFAIPSTWEWVRMADICRPISSGSTPSAELFQYDRGVPFLKVYNIRNQEIDFDYKRQFVDESLNSTKLSRSILIPGDVVMNIVGPPLGKVAIIPNTYPQWNCNQAIAFFGLIKPISIQYILNYLKEGSFLEDIELIGTAGQDNISVSKSKNILVPIPPLAEQHRIVAKIDQLMVLCDQLRSRVANANQLQKKLTDVLVEHAVVG